MRECRSICTIKDKEYDSARKGFPGYRLFRNCTEQMLLFVKKGSKPLRLNIRNFIEAPSGKRTSKPKDFERELIRLCEERGFKNQICYIFSGLSEELKDTDIFAIDKIFEENG